MHSDSSRRTADEHDSLISTERCDEFLTNINTESFRSWYRERERARNIREGKPYFNGPNPPLPPERHSPSRLLQCHRRTYYQLTNAPAETYLPKGLYWFGSRFETDIVLPFLRSLVDSELYVRNSMWIDFMVDSSTGELHFKGETDPVFVDGDSNPHLLTEIKTTTSVSQLKEARASHRAQAHVYMKGLSQQYETTVNDAVIIYGDRRTLDIRSFHVQFNPKFWRGPVLDWAAENSQYRQNQKLPPAQPETDWECSYCPYRNRCGQFDSQYADFESFGLLPRFEEYPRERVEEYLQAHSEARLTPTLAYQYPELATEYGVYDWQCPACSRTYLVEEIDWNGNLDQPPLCPVCCNDGTPVELAGPSPEVQQAARGDEEATDALG